MSPGLLPIIQSVLTTYPTEGERYRSGKTGIRGEDQPKLVNVLLTPGAGRVLKS